MKKLNTIVIGLFILSGMNREVQAQWTRLNVNADENLYGVHFYTSTNGYAVGRGQNILRSTDAGATWTVVYQGQWGTEEFHSVYFVGPTLGLIVGGSGLTGVVLKTIDGGVSLDTVLEVSGVDYFNDIQMLNSTTGFVVGDKGSIYKTTDGGDTWTATTSGTSEELHGIHFLNNNNGYACGYGGTILKTTNGGSSWMSKGSGSTEDFYDCRFVSTSNGVAVGNNGIIMYTSDGGNSWSDVTLDNSLGIRNVHFADAITGYAVTGLGGIYKTVNGGQTWFKSRNWASGQDNLWAVHAIDDQIVIATGEVDLINFKSTIMRTTNGGGTAPPTGIEEAVSLSPEIQIHPNPASDFFILNTNGKKDVRFSLVNLQGETVYSSSVVSRDQKISVKHFQAGMYIAVVEDGGEVFRERVLVK